MDELFGLNADLVGRYESHRVVEHASLLIHEAAHAVSAVDCGAVVIDSRVRWQHTSGGHGDARTSYSGGQWDARSTASHALCGPVAQHIWLRRRQADWGLTEGLVCYPIYQSDRDLAMAQPYLTQLEWTTSEGCFAVEKWVHRRWAEIQAAARHRVRTSTEVCGCPLDHVATPGQNQPDVAVPELVTTAGPPAEEPPGGLATATDSIEGIKAAIEYLVDRIRWAQRASYHAVDQLGTLGELLAESEATEAVEVTRAIRWAYTGQEEMRIDLDAAADHLLSYRDRL